jgi:hypothetical protein
MDPYLETPDVWPGFHKMFASELTTELNAALPLPYYAALQVRGELGIVEDPVTDEVIINLDLIDHPYIEIRDSTRGHKLITLIEILSPSNKRPGADRKAYRNKQSEVLHSDANLVELDLLRGGRRIFADHNLYGSISSLKTLPDYLILVNRACRRLEGTIAYEAFPVSLREWLPCIPAPLKEGEADLPLDLQFVFNRAYDGGPYRRGAVDYSAMPPKPELKAEDAAWAAELTRPWREPRSADV